MVKAHKTKLCTLIIKGMDYLKAILTSKNVSDYVDDVLIELLTYVSHVGRLLKRSHSQYL